MDIPKTPSRNRESLKGKERLLSFLRGLLDDPTHRDCIVWVNRQESVFKLIKPHKVAMMWGDATGNPTMTYDKMSRALRYLYDVTLKKIPGKDSRYQFIEAANATPVPQLNFLTPRNDNKNSSLLQSSSSSSESSPATPPIARIPIAPIAVPAPMLNPFATMDATQIGAFLQNNAQLSNLVALNQAQFVAFKNLFPFLQALSIQDQLKIFLNCKNDFPMLFPAVHN